MQLQVLAQSLETSNWARGLAWYARSFGSSRPEFESQRAHYLYIFIKGYGHNKATTRGSTVVVRPAVVL